MSDAARVMGDLRVTGDLTVGGNMPKTERSNIVQTALAKYPIPLTNWRVHDALQTNLPGTSSADDLAISGNTFGTNTPKLTTGDLKAAGAVTRYARALRELPPEYDPTETVQIRVSAGMETTVADTAATVDVEVYRVDREGGVDGADLVSTSAQDINSLTFGNKDFTVDAASLAAGDILDVRVALAVNDGATGTAVIGSIGSIELLADIRG